MKFFDAIAMILLIIGGINMALEGIFHFDIIKFIFGDESAKASCAYIVIALAAIYNIFRFKNLFLNWGSPSSLPSKDKPGGK
jgi:uncharacterized protein